jgi:hypothetical protein
LPLAPYSVLVIERAAEKNSGPYVGTVDVLAMYRINYMEFRPAYMLRMTSSRLQSIANWIYVMLGESEAS